MTATETGTGTGTADAGRVERIDVAIVGAGPSGLAAAQALARAGAGRIVVLDREAQPGGIPRHADHHGYGLRDMHRSLTGPEYARRWVERASAAGAEIRAGTQATGWTGDRGLGLELTSPAGRTLLRARAVVLATGCRERPRAARLVAGTRPQGVMTTGMLQQIVHLGHESVGRRAVIVGAEHVSFSALMTLARGGARTVAMVTEQARHQSYAAFRGGALLRYRVPLLTRSSLTVIRGRRRVESVQIVSIDDGASREIECDLVIFSADWIPDHELALLAGAQLDPGTRGPAVDAALRTSVPGLFATGNLLHGAETADVAALTGRHVAAGVTSWLERGDWPQARVPLVCDAPLLWVTPNLLSASDSAQRETIYNNNNDNDNGIPARDRFLLRAQVELRDATVVLTQGDMTLLQARLPMVMPGRSARLQTSWLRDVRPDGGALRLRVASARRRRA